MAVTSVVGSSAPTTTQSGDASRQQIASNFQNFLLLLTTQLKNQNPLEPLNTNDFTSQLVQFASVEQQLKSNDTLSALLASTRAANLSTAVGIVGKQVTADGSTSALANGSAKWKLNLPRDARTVTLTVADASNNVVWTQTRAMASGDNIYEWNGRNATGQAMPDGSYKLTAVAVDAAGARMTPKIELSGIVDRIEMQGDATILRIGEFSIPLDKVTSIAR